MRTSQTAFLRFAGVGAAGFVVDAGVLQTVIGIGGASPYAARLVSYLAAATFTWWMNRRITFAAQASARPAREWLRFLAANAAGGALNYAVFAALIAGSAVMARFPVLAVGAGSLCGLICNYVLSRRLVFADTPRAAFRRA